MKRYLILLGLLGMVRAAVGNDKMGQFGIEIAPGISFNRIYSQRENDTFHSGGIGFKLSIGGKYNFHLQEYFNLSIGLFLLPKEVTIKGSIKEKDSSETIYESHALWYFQIPVLCKFYTNEIFLDTKVYFKLGIAVAGFLSDRLSIKEKDQEKTFMNPRPVLLPGIIGFGIKYDFGLTTAFLVGLSYQYDIFGIAKKRYHDTETVWYYNDFVCLDLGFAF